MTKHDGRRDFIKNTTLATLGTLAGAQAARASSGPELARPEVTRDAPEPLPPAAARKAAEAMRPFEEFSRWQPSYGWPLDSPHYVGKLVPGLREPGLPPVPFETPDLDKVPWKIVDGRKEYHLYCQPVSRELLPGYRMNFFGYNGSLPGPAIEAVQGDRIRIVVHNELPEPTTVHWHGLELPVDMDGVPFLVQDPIMPGDSFAYEYDLHQAGTFFYHSHMPMQEAFGMAGFFIIHPAATWEPRVDRDFGLMFQNFQIGPNTTVPDAMAMDWNWQAINGRSGPFTTPLVIKHGQRVRIRVVDFSPQQHHPIHIHGHTFWVTGHEGSRIPYSAWIPRNNTLVGVAQGTDFEFVANNPGDWLLHCHMVHHMMNHMTEQVGPRIRQQTPLATFKADLQSRPNVSFDHENPAFDVVGYPEMMHMHAYSDEAIRAIESRRECRGLRPQWYKAVKGLMTFFRVLPEDLYNLVMHSDEPVPPGYVFEEIKRRRKEYERKHPATELGR
ncbi:MAG: copper oxidase [Planctomycetota bacterium]|nr:MAG: copper oxidase [Planctomycetota bacterium]